MSRKTQSVKMKHSVTTYFSILLLMFQYLSCEPVVNIGNSTIVGQSIRNRGKLVNRFLGVPYAKPPIGKLRFKKPEPIQDYPMKLEASKMPPICPQYTDHPFPWYDNSPNKSEDCLYLNIWVPSNTRRKLPVLYWIYGGGFRYGSITLPLYSGIPLAVSGGLIVVTVNYRVGPFGFLTSNTPDAPGNLGLYDILEGLRWVNQNIGSFGGDASKITIAGVGAGAWAVGLLAVSPLSEGLYKRQIMESGSPTHLAAENKTRNLALSQRLAETVGCANTTFTIEDNPGAVVECLREVNSSVLANADYMLNPKGTPTFIYEYGDDILPQNPRISIMNGDFRCTELLIGNTRDEGSVLLTIRHPEIFGFFGEKDTLINKSTGADYIKQALKDFPDPEPIVQYYLPDTLSENAGDDIRYQTYTSLGDTLLLCPTVYQAEKCAEKEGKAYFYFWTNRPSNTPFAPWMGSTHFSEVQFVFGSPLLHPSNYTTTENLITRNIIALWSNFAKVGIPVTGWPVYSKEKPVIRLLGSGQLTPKYSNGPHKENCDFLRSYFTSV